jgi:hypothetical protein
MPRARRCSSTPASSRTPRASPHAGLLGWAKSCTDDPSGCTAGAFRYHPGSRRTDQTGSIQQSTGFTLSGPQEAYVLQGTTGNDAEGDFECPCRLEQRTVRWR